jgi:hypothetical protein
VEKETMKEVESAVTWAALTGTPTVGVKVVMWDVCSADQLD